MLRFTIRDLLWLTVVVAILCWWATERKKNSDDSARMLKHHDRLQNRVYEQDAAIRRLQASIVTESGGRLSIPPETLPAINSAP